MSDSVIIIPTFNEIDNVERMTRKVLSLEKEFDILYVDDSSPDGTADVICELQKEFPGRIHLEVRKGKLGLGTAYIGTAYLTNKRNLYFTGLTDGNAVCNIPGLTCANVPFLMK